MAYGFNADKSKFDIVDMDKQIAGLVNAIYPVGSIYMSTRNVNPTNFFGGTWVAWGAGRVPVGVDTSDNNFSTVERTGGAEFHTHSNPPTGSTTLTAAQSGLPAHTHALGNELGLSSGSWAGEVYSGELSGTGAKLAHTTGGGTIQTKTATGAITGGAKAAASGHNHTMGDTGHASTLQPYITCYMWKRTA